jgi:hypothetical protein
MTDDEIRAIADERYRLHPAPPASDSLVVALRATIGAIPVARQPLRAAA